MRSEVFHFGSLWLLPQILPFLLPVFQNISRLAIQRFANRFQG